MKKIIKYLIGFLNKILVKPKSSCRFTTIYNPSVIAEPMGGPQGQIFYFDFNFGQMLPPNKPPLQHLEPEPLISIEKFEEMELQEKNNLTKFPTTTTPIGHLPGLSISGGTSMDGYYERWCGTTNNELSKTMEKEDESLDPTPLKRFVLREFNWIKDVSVDTFTTINKSKRKLCVILTISPTHYSELMNNEIERKVREKIHKLIAPLVHCMYTEHNESLPLIVFQPEKSETILDLI